MMHMQHRMVQTQTQRLMLTQKMQQAIQILQLSGLELEQFVQEEMETNPTLEVDPSKNEVETPPETQKEEEKKDETEQFDDVDFDLDDYANAFGDRAREGRDLSYNTDHFAKLSHYENSITRAESLSSHLMTQLHLAVMDDQTQTLGEMIVGDINSRGYFTGDLQEIADDTELPLEAVECVLKLVQSFEPTGVGARDVVECLLLQINVEYPDNANLRTLVAEHLDALKRRQVPKIAKAMGISPEEVEDLREVLSTLNPWPGNEYESTPTQYVTPDLIVEKIDGKWDLRLTNERVPQLNVSNHYRRMIRNGKLSSEEKAYVRQKVEAAKWLIRNIEQRQSTILRIGKAIIDIQEGFLDKGVEMIKPLTLQEIADKVGVHEATVSRTTRGKYIQTPQGLFELKYFFSPGLKHASGEDQSAKSVQLRIKQIIEKEEKLKPLSDQKIADMLKTEGLNIARRTVTKYREAFDIPSSTMRKSY